VGRKERVELVFYVPQHVRKHEWACTVEICRDGEVKTFTGRGVDSLQALLSAVSGLRNVLKPEISRLTWLGAPGEVGLPRLIAEEDSDYLALIDHLIAAEQCREILAAKRQRVKPRSKRTVLRKKSSTRSR
jgi:hypothetical protein